MITQTARLTGTESRGQATYSFNSATVPECAGTQIGPERECALHIQQAWPISPSF